MKTCPTCGAPQPNEEWDWTKPTTLPPPPWKFEGRAVVAEPTGEVNVLHCKLLVALEMLRELGQREEFDRLAEKFVREKK